MSTELKQKWFERGVAAGKADGWMAVEDTMTETLERDWPQDAQDLVQRTIDDWEGTDHFEILYGSKMREDARTDIDLYSDLKEEFWEGYLAGRKQIGIDIYKMAEDLIKSTEH